MTALSTLHVLARRGKHLAARSSPKPFETALRPTDVFIVGFPKSGNTWLLYMLANLRGEHENDVLSFDEARRRVPDVNGAYFENVAFRFCGLPDPRVFTAHAPFDPRLPNVIYLVRDPRDALVSYWHYQRLTTEGFDLDLPSFVTSEHWPVDWGTHVGGWLDGSHQSVLLLSYETMRADPVDALGRVATFVGLEVGENAVEKAAAASTFSRMKAAEERFGFGSDRPDYGSHNGERFVRRGVVGGWRDELDAETIGAIERRYGSLMRRLGYETVSV